jgi:hypothetical protein
MHSPLLWQDRKKSGPFLPHSHYESHLDRRDEGGFISAFAVAIPYLASIFGGGALTLADVTGDGKLDITTTTDIFAHSTHSRSVFTVLHGNGDGAFGAPITSAESDSLPSLIDIAIADFSGGGKLDVAQGLCCAARPTSNPYVLTRPNSAFSIAGFANLNYFKSGIPRRIEVDAPGAPSLAAQTAMNYERRYSS